MFLWLPSVPKNKVSLDELCNQNNMCQIVIFFSPMLYILQSSLLQHLQDSHQQNTVFFGQS